MAAENTLSYPRPPKILYCQRCGNVVQERIPDDGDTKLRAVCTSCNYVHYQNPRLIVGTLPVWQDKVLLCLRNIEPRKGKWTLPAGFMELGETILDGALRETAEEVGVQVRPLELFSLIDVVHVGQVYVFYRVEVTDPTPYPGTETKAVQYFAEHQIPWDTLAFRTVRQTLQWYWQDRRHNCYHLHTGQV